MKIPPRLPVLTTLLGFAVSIAPLSAAITYVDAVEGASGNTFATGGSLATTTWRVDPGSSSANETQWGRRTGTTPGAEFGNGGGDIFQALHSVSDPSGDQMPELTTRISGLADGTYTVWAFYWDQVVSETQNWTLSAGLESGSLGSYSSPGEPTVPLTTKAGVVDAGTLSFTDSGVISIVNDGLTTERRMFAVNLGTAVVSGGSDIDVFVDALIGGGSLNRTWYDGVGYELIPEPSVALLMAVGAPGLLRRRRS